MGKPIASLVHAVTLTDTQTDAHTAQWAQAQDDRYGIGAQTHNKLLMGLPNAKQFALIEKNY